MQGEARTAQTHLERRSAAVHGCQPAEALPLRTNIEARVKAKRRGKDNERHTAQRIFCTTGTTRQSDDNKNIIKSLRKWVALIAREKGIESLLTRASNKRCQKS